MSSLNIHDYSEQELLTVIGCSNELHEITPKIIQECILDKLQQGKAQITELNTLANLKTFLDNISNKLNAYYNKHLAKDKEEKDLSIAPVHNYPLVEGVVNQLERQTITKTISIDSIFRENAKNTISSNFIWTLPSPEHQIISIQLTSFELPIMWYNISDKRNTNTFIIGTYNINIPDVTNMEHEIVLPSGNYMATDFANLLTNYMFYHGNGLQYLVCKVDPITSKTIIRARDKLDGEDSLYDINSTLYSPDFYFTVKFNNSLNGIGSFIGFTQSFYEVHKEQTIIDYTYNGSQNQVVIYEGCLQSEASYGNGRDNYIYISVNDYNNNYIVNSIVTSNNPYSIGVGEDILGRISVNESFSTIMTNTHSSSSSSIFNKREYLGPVSISKMHIKLLDKYGYPIDINNNDVSLAFEFTYLYSKINKQ